MHAERNRHLMTTVELQSGSGQWTAHGKNLIAQSMSEKGKAFLVAAMLLRQRGANEYAVLHLLCQGIEVLAKGVLLSVDYDTYHPKLRNYGHNLVRLIVVVEKASNIRLLNPNVKGELEALDSLYSKHLLRYGSGYDILVNPTTIPSARVLHRVASIIRLMRRIT